MDRQISMDGIGRNWEEYSLQWWSLMNMGEAHSTCDLDGFLIYNVHRAKPKWVDLEMVVV